MAVPGRGRHTALGGQLRRGAAAGRRVRRSTRLARRTCCATRSARVGGGRAAAGGQRHRCSGFSRLTYSLATQPPDPERARPAAPASTARRTWRSCIASVLAFALALPSDIDFLAGIFAFGAMLAFTIAHLSVIALRFREPDRSSASTGCRCRSASAAARCRCRPLLGALIALAGWVSVLVLHEGARYRRRRAGWSSGSRSTSIYRRGQDKPLRKRFTIPAAALAGRAPRSSTAASSCRCSATSSTTTSSAPRAGSRPRRATRARAAP